MPPEASKPHYCEAGQWGRLDMSGIFLPFFANGFTSFQQQQKHSHEMREAGRDSFNSSDVRSDLVTLSLRRSKHVWQRKF